MGKVIFSAAAIVALCFISFQTAFADGTAAMPPYSGNHETLPVADQKLGQSSPNNSTDRPTSKPIESRPNPDAVGYYGFIIFGAAKDVKSTTDITLATGTTTSGSETDLDDYFGGAEVVRVLSRNFGVAGDFEYMGYNYSSGGSSDTEMTALIVPRVQIPVAGDVLWIGFGLGGTSTHIGQVSSSSGGETISTPNRDITGFTWSPRIGLDSEIGRFLFGGQVSYVSTNFTNNISVNNSSTGAQITTGTTNTERNWVGIAIRVGMKF